MADQAVAAHAGLAAAFRKGVLSAHWWAGDPGRGDALIADLHAVVTQLEAGTAIDEEFLAEMSSAATAGEWTRLQRACYDRLSPTRLSYRIGGNWMNWIQYWPGRSSMA